MQDAFEAHQRNEFEHAEAMYRDLLIKKPKDFNLLHLLGLVCFQTNRLDEADRLMAEALLINPKSADAESNHGLVLLKLNRPEDAVKRFKSALRHDPKSEAAMANYAVGLIGMQRFEEALQWSERQIKLGSKSVEIQHAHAEALIGLERYPAAVESFKRVLEIDPERVSAILHLVVCYNATGEPAESARYLERALAIDPANADALLLKADDIAHGGNLDEALKLVEKASSARPESIALHLRRSKLLGSLERYEEAKQVCETALNIKPDDIEALFHLGIAQEALLDFGAALDSYERVLAQDPDHAAVRWNAAYCQLMLGRLADGFRNYEWRWKTPFLNKKIRFSGPRWLGEFSVAGKRLLLYSEQGFGDTFQFLRYVRLVEELGAEVLLEVPKAVVPLVAPMFGADRVFETDAELPDFDFHCPLPSLPLAMRTTENSVPHQVPYLSADPALVVKWREILPKANTLRIGVVWSGNPDHVNDSGRSILLDQFLDAFPEDVQLIALQKVFRSGDALALRRKSAPIVLAEQLESFADTAAVIETCDLVVSVDTGVAHLAAAMNKPTWVLVDVVSDWRWQRGRTDSPWYPSIKLYRQTARHQWSPVLIRVRDDIKAMLPRKGLRSLFRR
jgi:tetratricopeptide (TPR) repeat protein